MKELSAIPNLLEEIEYLKEAEKILKAQLKNIPKVQKKAAEQASAFRSFPSR